MEQIKHLALKTKTIMEKTLVCNKKGESKESTKTLPLRVQGP